MNLTFHQTFKPEKKHITSLLYLAENKESFSLQDISNETGIPTGKSSGKVRPHLDYAQAMGLLKYTVSRGIYTISLTELGELVLEEDSTLSEELTLLLLHALIVREKKGAELWSFCFKNFPNHNVYDTKYEYFKKEVDTFFDSDVLIGPLKGSYDDFFNSLNLLDIDQKDDVFRINNIGFDTQYEYLYAYILYEYMDLLYPDENEISEIQFFDLNYRFVFGWSKSDELEVLERLSDKGLIRLNKQLSPFTIVKCCNKEDILSRLYSDLL